MANKITKSEHFDISTIGDWDLEGPALPTPAQIAARDASVRSVVQPILASLKPDFFKSAFDDFYSDEEDKPEIHNVFKQDNGNQEVCKKCSAPLSNIDGNTICKPCGILYDDIKLIDESAEWRYYGAEDSKGNDPTRCGMPVDPLLPKSSLTTVIRGKANTYMGKLHAWNSIPYKERSLSKTFREIQDICNKLNLPNSIFTDAKSLYKIIHEIYNTRKINRSSLICACIIFSAKNNGYSITTKKLADTVGLERSDVTEGCKTFVKMLHHSDFQYNVETTGIHDYIIQYCRQLNMSNKMMQFCNSISEKVKTMEILQEHTCPSIAIGCIYFVCQLLDLPITKKFIHETCNISEVTITKTFKKLEVYRDAILFTK
jgi:transcription initiation factor TFIIIB Brf1 subunit/transcription initiation factor TFIIB